jgi:radical SAM protein with 4Fe4S-binding SPASM domain
MVEICGREMKPQCIIPWVYMEIFPDGTVTPCCSNWMSLGNIKDTKIEDIFNSDQMNKFRLEMLGETLPSSCSGCSAIENYGGNEKSLRSKYNKVFESSFSEVNQNTNTDGSLKKIKFKGWDFKISNKCNFKCRMCCPELSTRINQENKEHSLRHFNKEVFDHSTYLNIPDFVDKYIDDFELIEFAGGETLLMDDQYYLLQTLIERGRTNINLWYNTNMSVLKYKNKNILDYWRQWDPDKLKVYASIDEIGERAEYIRSGTVWNAVEKNLKIISKEKFKRHTNITVTCYNIFRLPEIIQHLMDIGYVSEDYNYRNFDLSLETSDWNISILTDEFREEIKNKLLEFINKYPSDISDIFVDILNCLQTPMNVQSAKKFLIYNTKIDKIRGEKGFNIIPELLDIVNYFKTQNETPQRP